MRSALAAGTAGGVALDTPAGVVTVVLVIVTIALILYALRNK